jgi:O-antigen/teichoic acid export membrane protein
VFKSGLILALASLFGFFSNFIFSVFLEKEAYGEIVTLFSLVSIFVLVAPLGTNAFFLSHRDIYSRYANAIIVFPVLISLLIGSGFLIADFSLLRIAFIVLLAVGTLSVQGIMASQIKQDGPRAAIYQSIQPFLKSVAALFVLASLMVAEEKGWALDILAVGLLIGGLFAIPLMLSQLVDIQSGGGFFDFAFFRRFKKTQWVSLISFWLSSILGVSYSLGIIPLVSYFYGNHYAAYLGIYFILWSGGNILITVVINNYYWPRWCAVRSLGEERRGLLLKSLYVSAALALMTFLGAFLFSFFMSSIIWNEYIEIDKFLTLTSFALGVRVLSAWIGMMLLSNDQCISYKVMVQFFVLVVMGGGVVFYEISSVIDIAIIIIFLELLCFFGYLLYSLGVVRDEKYFSVGVK